MHGVTWGIAAAGAKRATKSVSQLPATRLTAASYSELRTGATSTRLAALGPCIMTVHPRKHTVKILAGRQEGSRGMKLVAILLGENATQPCKTLPEKPHAGWTASTYINTVMIIFIKRSD